MYNSSCSTSASLQDETKSVDETTACSDIEQAGITLAEDALDWKNPTVLRQKGEKISILLIKRIDDDDSTDFAIKVLEFLGRHNTFVMLEDKSYADVIEKASDSMKLKVNKYSKNMESSIDFVIVIGGDGTVMYSLKFFQKQAVPPIMAFSTGALNFLCNAAPDDYENLLGITIKSIESGVPVELEKRQRLLVEYKTGSKKETQTYHSLNDMVIGTGTSPTMLSVDAFLEGKYFGTFVGDGVIVSTPTGSTAYQLSTGGPIINHLMSCMSISTIAGVSLSNRPVVLPSGLKLTFRNKKGKERKSILNVDGQLIQELDPDFEVSVTGSTLDVPFFVGRTMDTLDNWIHRLRNFLGWNRSFFNDKEQPVFK